uniref:Putative subtilase family protein n=1 Tax=termite gut metagenome TaxID=433724 RepID=S0DFN7_9ZZZZ
MPNPEAYFVEGYSYNTVILEGEISSDILDSFKTKEEIVSATYLLKYNGSQSAYTNEFIVKLKDGTSFARLKELADKTTCRIGKEDEFVKNQYMLYISNASELDAIQTANMFYETGLFEFAEPNLIDLAVENSSDTYFTSQWGLKKTAYNEVDINIEPAWVVTKGSPNIRIAVIDSGVDLTHPDLQGNLLAGYDATGLGTGGGPYYDEVWNGLVQVTKGDSHGTAVAGIIAALQNSEGISGVAPFGKSQSHGSAGCKPYRAECCGYPR